MYHCRNYKVVKKKLLNAPYLYSISLLIYFPTMSNSMFTTVSFFIWQKFVLSKV